MRTEPAQTRRGRPSQLRLKEIDKDILAAACMNFLEYGYSGASMDNVAKAAGISKTTLYSRYPDKIGLFEAVARDRMRVWSSDIPNEIFASNVPVEERLLQRGLSLLQMLRLPEVNAFLLLISAERIRFPYLARSFRKEGYAPLIQLVAEDLRTAAQLEGWTIADPQSVSENFLFALIGWNLARDPEAPLTDDECVAVISRLTTIFLAGKAVW